MRARNLDGFLLFSKDSHLSVCMSHKDARVKFISGFEGDNGACFVTNEDAVIWTDGW